MTPSHAIEIRGASIFYRREIVLQDASHRFPSRGVTSILGPSGSGKSTLLRTFNRMNDRIDGFGVRGGVWVRGREIYANGVDVYRLRRDVGMVFQKPCVFPRSVYENVVFGLKHLQPERRREFPALAEAALREAFLWDEVKDRLDRPAGELSQGQQQRLAMARVLISKPEILLMDEPTSALDPKSSLAIEDLILSLKRSHAILLATHNVAQARRVSDEAVFLCGGRIREAGGAEKLLAEPDCPETRDYLQHAG